MLKVMKNRYQRHRVRSHTFSHRTAGNVYVKSMRAGVDNFTRDSHDSRLTAVRETVSILATVRGFERFKRKSNFPRKYLPGRDRFGDYRDSSLARRHGRLGSSFFFTTAAISYDRENISPPCRNVGTKSPSCDHPAH